MLFAHSLHEAGGIRHSACHLGASKVKPWMLSLKALQQNGFFISFCCCSICIFMTFENTVPCCAFGCLL